MGLIDIFKKKSSSAIICRQQPTLQQVADKVYQQTGKEIADGFSRPTASTGKPMDELYGAAKRVAQMSNIGGGSKASDGGIDKGLDTWTKYAQARTAKKMIDNVAQKKIDKK